MITFRNLTDEKLSRLIEGYKLMKKNSRSEQFQRDLEEELRLARCIEGNIESCGKEVQLASDTFDLESKFPGLIFLMRKADIKIATFDEMNKEQKEATNGWRGKDLNEAEEVFYISDDLNNSWQILSQVLIETYTNYDLTSGFAEELKEGQTLYDLKRPDSEIEGFASMLRLAVEEDSDLTLEDINDFGVLSYDQQLDTLLVLKLYSDRFSDEVIASHISKFRDYEKIPSPSYLIRSDSERITLMEDFKMFIEGDPDKLNGIGKMKYAEFVDTIEYYLSNLDDYYSWDEGNGPSMFIDMLEEDYPKVEKSQTSKNSNSIKLNI